MKLTIVETEDSERSALYIDGKLAGVGMEPGEKIKEELKCMFTPHEYSEITTATLCYLDSEDVIESGFPEELTQFWEKY